MHPVDVRLDVAGLLLVGDKDSFRACRNHDVLQSHAKNRHIELIDDVRVLTGLIECAVSDHRLLHGLGQRVPGSHILPGAGKPHDGNRGFLLGDGVVEADLLYALIFGEQVIIILEVHEFMSLIQNVADPVGKDAAVPESASCDVIRSRFGVRLLPEFQDL